MCGETTATELPISDEALDQFISQGEGFVAKFDAAGELQWLTYLGGSGQDLVNDLALGPDALYVVGETSSRDFPGAPPVEGPQDAFVAAISLDGTSLYYSVLIGGSDYEAGYAIAVENRQAFITGITYSIDLAPNAYLGEGDAFVTHLDASGKEVYTRIIGGSSADAGFDLAVLQGDVWVVGQTSSLNFPEMGLLGSQDGFAVRLDSSGGTRWVTYLGGSGEDNAQGIAVDEDGRAFITGVSGSEDFPYGSSLSGPTDAYLARLGQDGEEEAAVRLGGSRDELGRNVALTGYGQVLWCGLTLSSDFPTTTNAVQRNLLGLSDAFLVSYDAETLNPNKNAYSTLLGSTGEDACNALSGTTPGLALLVGETSAEDFPVTLEGVGIGESDDGFFALLMAIPPNSPTPVPTATLLPVTKTPIVLLTPTIPLDYTPLAASATPLLSATLPPMQGGTPVFLPQIESVGKPKSTGAAVPSKHTPTPEQPVLPSETPAEVEPTPVKEKNNTWLIAGVVMLVLAGGVLGFWLRKSRHAK